MKCKSVDLPLSVSPRKELEIAAEAVLMSDQILLWKTSHWRFGSRQKPLVRKSGARGEFDHPQTMVAPT